MSKRADGDASQATILVTVTVKNPQTTTLAPQLLLQFPGNNSLTVELTDQAQRPASKKSQKLDTTQVQQQASIYPETHKQLVFNNPDSLVQQFINEQLKVQLEDGNTKQKQQAQVLTFDVSGLLTAVEFQNSFSLACGGLQLDGSIDIKIISSKHENCRVTRFLSPRTLPVLTFKVLTAEGIFQHRDSEWRRRYLAPVRVELELLGQKYCSEGIDQGVLGDEQFSTRFDVRINCAYAVRESRDLQLLRQQIEEECVTIRVFSRGVRTAAAEAERRAKSPGKAQRSAAAAQPPAAEEYVKFHAQCRFSIKDLLSTRIVDRYVQLQPAYAYGRKQLGDCSPNAELAASQRVPAFLPRVSAADSKGKPLVVAEARETPFSEYQRDPETMPLGDWSRSLVHVVGALQQPLNSWASGGAAALGNSAAVTGTVPAPAATHFERFYIYLSPKQIEITKQLLNYVADVNFKFILQHSDVPKYRAQFGERKDGCGGHGDDIGNYAGVLSLTGLSDCVQHPNYQSADLNYISGYRFVDRFIQLIYLEAPAKDKLFAELRALLDKTHIVYKSAPSAVFRQRIFGQSPFLLLHFTLEKSIIRLTTSKSRVLTDFMRLFNVTDNKLFPIEPIKLDMRGYQEANIFYSYEDVLSIIQQYGGNVPKNIDISTLFSTADNEKSENSSPLRSINTSPSLYSFEKESILGKNEVAAKSKPVKMIQMNPFRDIQQIPTPDIPDDLVMQRVVKKQSQKQLPAFKIQKFDNLVLRNSSFIKTTARGDEIADEIANQLAESANLKSKKVVREVLEGKKVYLYSQQQLNKFNIQNILIDKTFKGRCIDVQVDSRGKNNEMYQLERGWKQ